MRSIAASLLLLVASGPAFAQTKPSFNCAKVSGAAERAICTSPDLAALDRTMAALYTQILDRLSGPAKEHLIKDQARWIGARNGVCAYEPAKMAECLWEPYERRIARLKQLGDGAYPFIGEHWLVKNGKVGNIFYRIDAGWPRFDGGAADFSGVNRDFADRTRRAADEAIPDAQTGRDAEQQEWIYEQSFELYRPAANTVAASMNRATKIGSSRSDVGVDGFLIDLRTGKAVGPEQVFASAGDALGVLSTLVHADLEKLFKQKRSSGAVPGQGKLVELLRDPTRYHYRSDRLAIIFEPGIVISDQWGWFTVEVPYATLKPLLRADGPLGR